MKKLISVALVAVLTISAAVPAGFASGDNYREKLPTVYVGPLGNTDIYENPGTPEERVLFRPAPETIVSIAGKILPALVVLALTRDYERFGDVLIDAVDGAMGALKLDGDGNSAKNVSVKLEKPTDPNCESYYFHYDWRLDPVEVAAQLREFVSRVKDLTGADKVNFKASSMGGVVATAYFNEYGFDDVAACVFQCCPISGTAVAGDLLRRKIKLDAGAVLDYATGAYPPADPQSAFLYFLFNFLYYGGILDAALSIGDRLIEKLETKVFDELMTPVFGTLLGLWSFVPGDAYEEAKAINLDPETQAGLIAKADYYHYRVQARAREILISAVENGVRIMIVVGRGLQRTPLVESLDADSDATVDVKYASVGAVAAPLKGTLGEGYVQKANDGKNRVSPDNKIDASTCALPDCTWFIKDMLHANCHDGISEMYDWFMYSEEPVNVWSDPRYPQFLQNDKPNKRLVPMGNFAPGAVPPETEPGNSFHDKYEKYAAPAVNAVFAFLDKIREAAGLNAASASPDVFTPARRRFSERFG